MCPIFYLPEYLLEFTIKNFTTGVSLEYHKIIGPVSIVVIFLGLF